MLVPGLALVIWALAGHIPVPWWWQPLRAGDSGPAEAERVSPLPPPQQGTGVDAREEDEMFSSGLFCSGVLGFSVSFLWASFSSVDAAVVWHNI